jgi:Ca2+-transporting ATPase
VTSAQVSNRRPARASERSAFNGAFLRNRLLWASLAAVLALQVAAVHWPPLAAIFGTVPLGVADWALAVAVACSVLLVEELRKLVLSRRRAPGFRGA